MAPPNPSSHVGAAATVIDGHAMARKGEAGRAFGAGFAASLAGGLVGAVVLALNIPVLRPVLLSIGSPELLAFRASAGASQCGGFCVKARDYWASMRARRPAEKVGHRRTGEGRSAHIAH
jgi:TctA family transporter